MAREPVVELNSRDDNFWQQNPMLMKLISVDRAFKELQNDTLFSSKLFSTGAVPSKIHSRNLKVPVYRFFKRLYLYLQQYKVQPNEKDIIL